MHMQMSGGAEMLDPRTDRKRGGVDKKSGREIRAQRVRLQDDAIREY